MSQATTALAAARDALASKRRQLAALYDAHRQADGSFSFNADVRAQVKALQDEATTLAAQYDDLKETADADAANRKALAAVEADSKPAGRPTLAFSGNGETKAVATDSVKSIESGESAYEKFVATGPFKSVGHFANVVRSAGDRPGQVRSGLLGEWREKVTESYEGMKALFGEDAIKAAPTGLGEFADADGGVLVPVQYSAGLWSRSLEDDFNFLSLPGVQTISVSGNSVKVPAFNDKSRADGSRWGGVRGYWRGENEQGVNTKPTFRTIDLRLEKLMVLVPATEELLEDTTAAEAMISRVASEEIRFKTNDAMFRGTGVGMPLGFLNAACKVTTTSNNGANNTVSATDIDNMYVRRAKPSGQGYIWLANQDVEPQLKILRYTEANTGAIWAYTPGGSFGQAMPMLAGKPVYYTEFNESLGTEGDIVLIDPSQYAIAVKSTGIRSAVSMHLRFDYDESVFKFVLRMDARPYWESALTRFKGSNSLSPIITLETTRSS